jgi:glutaredoxin
MAFFSRVFLPFLLLVYIAAETYMKLQKTSLCGDIGCKLAGDLLRFDPMYLNYFGLAGVFSLLAFGYFSLKNKAIEKLFFIVLYSAIAFESTIISYQFMANPEPCIFCLGIFSSLLAIALFSKLKSFALVLAVVLSIFLGMNTLTVMKNKSYVNKQGLYLIQSKGCSHCAKVKKFFKEENIKYTPISISEVNARSFLKFVNISSIPVLLIKDASGTRLLTGDKKIIAHFKQEVPMPLQEAPQSSSSALPIDFFGATSEPGCAITITETATCEDENKTKETNHQ